jgi:hypothetical protein
MACLAGTGRGRARSPARGYADRHAEDRQPGKGPGQHLASAPDGQRSRGAYLCPGGEVARLPGPE